MPRIGVGEKLGRFVAAAAVATAAVINFSGARPVSAPETSGDLAQVLPKEVKTWAGLMDSVLIPEAELSTFAKSHGFNVPEFSELNHKYDELMRYEVCSRTLGERMKVETRWRPETYSGMAGVGGDMELKRIDLWVDFGTWGSGAKWENAQIDAEFLKESGFEPGVDFKIGIIVGKYNRQPYIVLGKLKEGKWNYEYYGARQYFDNKKNKRDVREV